MTLQEQLEKVQKELKDAQATISKLQEEIKKNNTVKRWNSDYDEDYCFIQSQGAVAASFEENYEIDSDRYNNGNKFKTMELATYYRNKRAARNRLECLALAIEGRPYEFNPTAFNWYIYKVKNSNTYSVANHCYCSGDNIYFSSEENAQLALEGTSEEDRKLLWGGK